MKQPANKKTDNTRLLFGVGGFFSWAIIITLIIGLAVKKPAAAPIPPRKGHIFKTGTHQPARRIDKPKPYVRKQPFVYLNSDADIKPGTVLIVWSVTPDTIVVY